MRELQENKYRFFKGEDALPPEKLNPSYHPLKWKLKIIFTKRTRIFTSQNISFINFFLSKIFI